MPVYVKRMFSDLTAQMITRCSKPTMKAEATSPRDFVLTVFIREYSEKKK